VVRRINAVALLVAVTCGVIAACRMTFGFAPLALFGVPIAVALHASGPRLAILAATMASVTGDYFFVAPVGHVTVFAEGSRLLMMLAAAAVAMVMIDRLVDRAAASSS